TTSMFGEPMQILTPYMQIWVFPTKDFLKVMLKESMETGIMPGPEEKRKETSASDIEKMRNNPEVVSIVNDYSQRYGGEAKFIMNLRDGDETVFRAYIKMNPNTMVEAKTVPLDFYEEDIDATLTMDFEFFYNMIVTQERSMRGGHIEKPPWAEGVDISESLGGFVNGINMWFMIQGGISSGQITSDPPGSLNDVLRTLQFVMGDPEDSGPSGEGPSREENNQQVQTESETSQHDKEATSEGDEGFFGAPGGEKSEGEMFGNPGGEKYDEFGGEGFWPGGEKPEGDLLGGSDGKGA
ncbi:MAG: hypothetical protein KKC05_02175, partial [Nanoarchaeota archaeon]|nr:hypothetical protein [Nanoarchaeota archaeon]